MHETGELPAELQAVVDAVSGEKENVQSDLGAVTELARRLAPQLARARDVLRSNPALSGGLSGARTAALNADKELARRAPAMKGAPVDALRALAQQLGA